MERSKYFHIWLGISALLIAGSAAFFSVFGLSKLFAGAALSVVIMAGSLELGKLVTAAFLYRYWDAVNWFQRVYLGTAVIVLVGITSAGIFGYLSNAYQGATIEFEKQSTTLTYKEDRLEQLEDDKTLLWETATIVDDTHYFVSEESTQVGSFNIISEAGDRVCAESGNAAVNSGGVNTEPVLGLPLLHEEALMIGQKESNQAGPSIGDLADMMFTENYSMMKKIQLDGGSGISSGDDLLLETGEHMIIESPSEGIKISDISSIYPSKFITNIERDLGHKTNLTHSAVIQTG